MSENVDQNAEDKNFFKKVSKELYHYEVGEFENFLKLIESGNLNMADFKKMSQSYSELLSQAKIITRVSDRLQKKLDNANQTIKAQNVELSGMKLEKEEGQFIIHLHPQLRRAMKQYLTFFAEFVLMSKGEEIVFEVSNAADGLKIDIGEEEDIDAINDHLNEYLGFLKMNVDELKVDTNEQSTVSEEILGIHLRNQLRMVKTDLELERVKNRQLEQMTKDFKDILLAQRNAPIQIAVTNDTTLNQQTEINVTLDIEIKIDDLISKVDDLSRTTNDSVPELDAIQAGLQSLKKEKEPGRFKRVVQKIKDNLKVLNDAGSQAHSILKNVKNGVATIKSVALEIGQILNDLDLTI